MKEIHVKRDRNVPESNRNIELVIENKGNMIVGSQMTELESILSQGFYFFEERSVVVLLEVIGV